MKNPADWWANGLRQGWLGNYEKELAYFIEETYGGLTEPQKLVVVFLSLFFKAGHTTLPLSLSPAQWGGIAGLEPGAIRLLGDEPVLPETLLQNTALAGTSPDNFTPIVVSGGHASFRRQFLYEMFISGWIKNKSNHPGNEYRANRISRELQKLFAETENENEVNWQKAAAALSAIRPFTIISGGPGTGKTTTVAKVLALHIRLAEKPLRIALAAPTGKAAGRMGEALHVQVNRLGLTDMQKSQIPGEAKTIHRLLSGTEKRGLLPSVTNKTLNYDVIVVDEASMIDLHLMYRLLSHLDEKTTLILLGDRNQLASVEAGAVFSDLCMKRQNSFSPAAISLLRRAGIAGELPEHNAGSLADSIVYLAKSYRYSGESGIGRLAEAVLTDKSERAKELFLQFDDLHYQPFKFEKEDIQKLTEQIIQDYTAASKITSAEELLDFWKQRIWLTVLRQGLAGSVRLNSLAEQQIMLRKSRYAKNGWYHGRPVIITRNDYSLGIFNGDTGVCIQKPDGEFVVYIESGAELNIFSPAQLLHVEPAYFLTVHKSQGSEFGRVNLLMPPSDTPILSKELIYTAISRAKNSFHLAGSYDLFLKGAQRKTTRYTGLQNILADTFGV